MSNPYIRIQRTSEAFGSKLSVEIFVDGNLLGVIPGTAPTSKDFMLPGAGCYQIQFKIDGCKSAIFECSINAGEYQNLRVELPPDPFLSAFYRRNNFGRLVPERQLPEKIRED
jgi:hypothetical protein